MMSFLLRAVLFFIFLASAASAQTVERGYAEPVPVDRIVAVVNDDVITLNELRQRLDTVLEQLRRQGTPLPPRDVLEQQMLERMVMEKVQIQHARDIGVHVDDAQLDQAIQRIAAQNELSMTRFRQILERDGVPFARFRENIRDEMIIARVREREVDGRIHISEAEIDHYLQSEAGKEDMAEEFEVAHILLRSPESASPEQVVELKAKADDVHQRAAQGENFPQLAAAYSDAPDGLSGGSLGWRSLDRLPSIFAEAVAELKAGEVAPLLRSPNGFHVVKLLDRRGGQQGAQAVRQTHARHILIRVDELLSDSEALHKAEGLHDRIAHGEDFAELARLQSQDGSAAKGGDLGWLYPGDTVPEFERAMDALEPGKLSRPVKTPFGYHLIEVLDRRVQEASPDRLRNAARQALRERKLDEAYQDWLRQTRDSAHVELKLEEN
ncbi:MAG: peptidylprolyl isomerase [Candidatus Accumulibacter sp.]|jgi:peptidyl-prolyl cis-trans isomerase SurA|nr:peptidylprolyl isomerase [Accumulibacter sp.]